mmetsp:Transcript_9928/g.23095  ORF Transcript_9928/g.23095 Transcript_9928/m.23095 type:complete len:308 (+) Transcript_9928:38-961(+)
MATLCLLLHANGLNRRVWGPFAAKLAAQHRVPLEERAAPRKEASIWRLGNLWLAALDLLGHGEAAPLQLAGVETDWMQFRHHVDGFLVECLSCLPEAPKEVVAIGHSLGGGVLLLTQAFAQKQRFSRIFIFEPMWLFVEQHLLKLLNLPEMPSSDRMASPLIAKTFRRRSEWPSRQEAVEDLSKKQFFATWDKQMFQAYLDGGLIGDKPCTLACAPKTEATIFLSGVPRALLQRLRSPDGLHGCQLEVSIGTNTTWTPQAAEALFGALRPTACIKVEPGGHMWPMECPADFARCPAVLSLSSLNSRL